MTTPSDISQETLAHVTRVMRGIAAMPKPMWRTMPQYSYDHDTVMFCRRRIGGVPYRIDAFMGNDSLGYRFSAQHRWRVRFRAANQRSDTNSFAVPVPHPGPLGTHTIVERFWLEDIRFEEKKPGTLDADLVYLRMTDEWERAPEF